MKRLLTAAALGAGLLAAAPGAFAAEYATVKLETTVNAPIDQVWAKVGGWCAIKDWLPRLAPCAMAGDGGIGSVRKLVVPDYGVHQLGVTLVDRLGRQGAVIEDAEAGIGGLGVGVGIFGLGDHHLDYGALSAELPH